MYNTCDQRGVFSKQKNFSLQNKTNKKKSGKFKYEKKKEKTIDTAFKEI